MQNVFTKVSKNTILILLINSYFSFSYAANINSHYSYENKTDENFQLPLKINNNTEVSIDKIEASLSQEVKNQKNQTKSEKNETSSEITSKIQESSINPSIENNRNNISPSTIILNNKLIDNLKPKSNLNNDINIKNAEQENKFFLDKKNFLKDFKNEPSLWQGASIVVAFISVIGILALFLRRIGKKGLFKKSKTENCMQIISSLSISPKRQIMLVQIKDMEFAISNTESGISFLSEINSSHQQREIHTEKKPYQISSYSTTPEDKIIDKNPLEKANKTLIDNKKSDILMKALKRMEKVPEPVKVENKKADTLEASPSFPKYYSTIFENESKKEIVKKEDQESVENVTNLIREKLRSMKPLS